MKEGLKVLVAYDGSKESKDAVAAAADIAERFKGSVTVLNVYWDPLEEKYEPVVEKTEKISIGDRGSMRILDDVEPLLKKRKIKFDLRMERNPNVPKTILRIAEDENYGCIALGSRGVGGARAWLLGSVSSRVIAEATCPVIVV
ncbi:MAG: universal stress protein [Candidatus Bathyarchaeota archaeon]